jgi:beta-mannanase
LLVTKEIQNINNPNKLNEYNINRISLKLWDQVDQKYVKVLTLTKQQIMEENGNKLRQQFEDMN